MNEQRIAVILAAHGEAETAGFVDNFSLCVIQPPETLKEGMEARYRKPDE